MKKSDLKTGMRFEIEYLRGNIYKNIAIKDLNLAIGTDNTHGTLSNSGSLDSGKILRVWDRPDDSTKLFDYNCKGKLLYEYKEEKIICTIDEIEYSESTVISMIKKATE